MYWLRQAVIIFALAVLAAGLWIRLDPAAGDKAIAWGAPEKLVSLIRPKPAEVEQAAMRGGAVQEMPVVISPASEAAIHDRVTAIGDGEALKSVNVYPRSEGMLTEIRVQAGDRVEAGQVLAVLDLELQTVARDQAQLAVRIAEEKVGRFERLAQSRAVSEVQLIEARHELENARLALRQAEIALERRMIVAPISGWIGILPVAAGDYVRDQTEIATIDDRSSLLVDFWVPERFAPMVEVGQSVEAEPIALPGTVYPGSVVAVGSRIDRVSRTLQVRARIDNGDDRLRPGMSFRVNLYFEGNAHVAVDPLAIQWSASGPYLWKNAGDRSERVDVQIVQRNADYVLVTGNVAAGDEVIIEGVQSLRPGAAITVLRRSGAPVKSEGS
jgi:RND family efflux transporter MFP subunit